MECKIPTDEIKQDIRDTLDEISNLEREERGYRIVGDRMSIFRADARINQIKERRAFVSKLEAILSRRSSRVEHDEIRNS